MHPVTPKPQVIFFTAVLQRDQETVKKLLEHHKELLFATISATDFQHQQLKKLDIDGGIGMNALHIARRLSNLAMMQLLLSYEGSEKLVNQTNFLNRTPLFMNYHYHERLVPVHVQMLKLLLSKGADVNIRDCEGRTAFYTVLSQPGCVQVMIDSVKAKAYAAFKGILQAHLHADPISIVFGYHTPSEVSAFIDNVGRPSDVPTPLGYLFSKFKSLKIENVQLEEIEVAKLLILHGADLQSKASDLEDGQTIFSVIRDWTKKKHPLVAHFKEVLSLEENLKAEKDAFRKSKAVSAEGGCCVIS